MPAKTEQLQQRVTLDLTRQPTPPADYATFNATAQTLQVIDETSFQIATEMIGREKAWADTVDAFFDEGRELAHRSWKWFTTTIDVSKKKYSARAVLEPRMKAFRAKQEADRRAEELRLQREQAEAARLAQVEADRIQRQADQAAAELRKQGDLRAAKEAQQVAQEQAQAVVQEAESMAEIGTILPDARPSGGPGEARPWVGEVTDIKALCLAIGEGKVPLEYLTPVRGQGDKMMPLVMVDIQVLNNLAKRLGKEDLSIPGVKGTRSLQLRFSRGAAFSVKTGSADSVHVGFSPEDQEPW
jgi:hypothetical protein